MRITQSIMPTLLVAALTLIAERPASAACGDSTLSGTYLYRANGFTYKGNAAINPMAATSGFTVVGILRLNGLGGGSGAESASNAGVLSDRIFTPSYQVNADCTATINLNYCPADQCAGPIPSLSNLVIASDGGQANFLNTVPDTTILGEIWKVPDGACSAQSLVGTTYRFTTSGSGLNGLGNAQTTASSVAFGTSGLIALNCDGTVSVQDVAAFGGLIFPRTQSGNWAINSDCSGTFLTGPFLHKSYVAGDGSQFVLLNGVPGTVVSGVYRKQ